ncbi:MAG: hypothetical protein ACLU85_08260 [Lachnospirales bacterium]
MSFNREIEKSKGLQTFFFKEKVSQNTAKYRNRFLKLKENGVNISRRHERNDADSRDIIGVIFVIIMV